MDYYGAFHWKIFEQNRATNPPAEHCERKVQGKKSSNSFGAVSKRTTKLFIQFMWTAK